MKKFCALLAAIVCFACEKENAVTDTKLVDLIFTSTNTPAVVSEGGNIVSTVKCYGPNLCYGFAKFDIRETATRQFEIRAKATYPNRDDVVCAQAIRQVDTTVSINAPVKGQYILRFYHNSSLFKADTVQVN